MYAAAAALALLAALSGLAWRLASRRSRIPCPAWLGWVLENPYTDRVAGGRTLVRRAGISPGMRVLDAGAGTGRVALAAAERVGPGGSVVALDLQPAMLDRIAARAAARGLRNVRVVCGPVERAPDVLGPGGRFDRVFLVTVLGEVPDRAAALRALHALLRPGGILSVTEFLPDPHFQPRGSVRRLAEAAGFVPGESYGTALAFTLNFRKEEG